MPVEMALTSLTTNLSALTFEAASEDDDPIYLDELEELEGYLRSLEMDMKSWVVSGAFMAF